MSDEEYYTEDSQTSAGGVTKRIKKKVPVSTKPPYDVKLTLKVPTFSPEDPEIWFALLEGQFKNLSITDDDEKYHYVVSNIDVVQAKTVRDVVINPPLNNKYSKIKAELIKRLTASHENKVRQLLTHEQLGDRKASQFLRHLQDLAGRDVPTDFIRSIWSSRLPQNIQTVLASQSTQSLDQLAELADRIQEITSTGQVAAIRPSTSASNSSDCTPPNELAELRQMIHKLTLKLDEHTRASCCSTSRARPHERHRSPARQRSRSNSCYRKYPVCWYHAKFGADARKCIKPCDYAKTGNATSSR